MINLSIWTFPLSVLLAAAFVVLLALCGEGPKRRLPCGLSLTRLSLAAMVVLVVATAIEGTWGGGMYRSWPFVGVVLLTLLLLGITAVGDYRRKVWSAAFLSHGGLLLVLWAGLFGAPDVEDAHIVVQRDRAEHIAYGPRGECVPLPFEVLLADFKIDYYADGTAPKQYTSTLIVDGERMTTSVNHPCRYGVWYLYQSDYDKAAQKYSVIKAVKDPWLPLVYFGMLMLTAGALLQVRQTWHGRRTLPVVVLLALVFGVISVARINFGTLMPALRSLWFVPHLIIYMVAYSLLALASVLGAWRLCAARREPAAHHCSPELLRKLLSTASALLLVGMLCGAVWAKAAWGHYWTWDAKECWAAATWLITLLGLHLPARRVLALTLTIWMAFLAMQVTWYGVNYLPSANNSLHTYNS